MRTLLKNMKPPKTSLYESLLDDFDDLEKDADEYVESNNYIGNYYDASFFEERGDFLINFELKELKKIKFKYNCKNDILLWKEHKRTKATITSKAICNIILNSDVSLLTENDKDKKYIETKNEIIKKLYSCSHLVDDKEFLKIDVRKSRLSVAAWYVNIYNDQNNSLFYITLKQKIKTN